MSRQLFQWGVHLTWCWPDLTSDQMQTWAKVSWGVHLTEGQPAHSSITLGHKVSLPGRGVHLVYVNKVVTHMATRCLCLGEGKVDILFNRHPASHLASLPAAIGQPTSYVTKYQPVRLWVGQMMAGTGSPTTLGPSPGSKQFHWFPLGSDLPDQGQACDTNELCSPLYTIGTTFRDHLQFCIYVISSHILAQNVENCYTDNFLFRPIYSYPSTINLMYY